tara:strand:+ start:2750 stop:2860 length:111 start_codon:yes stop_codon:yes gene_type:complete
MADMTIAKDLFFGEVGKTTTTTKGKIELVKIVLVPD